MKTFRFLFVVLITGLFFASCANDDDVVLDNEIRIVNNSSIGLTVDLYEDVNNQWVFHRSVSLSMNGGTAGVNIGNNPCEDFGYIIGNPPVMRIDPNCELIIQ